MYPCPFCDESFPSNSFFMSHIKVLHKTLMKSTCQCRHTGCSRSYNNIYALNRHLTTQHSVPSINLDSAKRPALAENSNSCDLPEISNAHDNVTENQNSRAVDQPCPSIRDFATAVDDGVTSLISKLYADSSLPRCFVQELIENLNKLYSSTIISLLRRKYNCSECTNPSDLNMMFDIAQQAFDNFETEHQNLKRLEDMKVLIKPKSLAINASLQSRSRASERIVVLSDVVIQIISMKDVLKKFLELPNVFSSILSHYEHCKSSPTIMSAVQGELWTKIERKFEGKIVLPLILYFDDFEINNPLGSHKNLHKLGAVYFSIACLPSEYYSMLENIFLAQLHNSKDHKAEGNRRTFANLIDQIIDLEKNGLIINVTDKEQRVYFALLSIVGDNLGIHEICGYTTSFNSLNWCRVCLADKSVAQYQLKENTLILRTVENYDADSANCCNGIKEQCVFNEILSYHVTENVCLDIMHDIFEGVCRYDLAKILTKYINDEKLFSLDMLNSRIQFFDYGSSVGKNVPPSISGAFLKTQNLLLSASEMKFLVSNLGLLVGDLVPLNDKTWELYLSLREIINIVLSSVITVQTTELLGSLISEHHSLYLELFSEPLKPKHHLLVHYPRLMAMLGPLKHFSCIRFEAKHKQLKQSAKVVTSRRNPALTLALKHQLNLAYRFVSQDGFSIRLNCGPILAEKLTCLVSLHKLQNIIPQHIANDTVCTSWVQVNGTFYRTGMVIVIDSNNVDYSFGEIKCITTREMQTISFLYTKFHTLCLSRHVHAFEVAETKAWGFIDLKKIVDYSPRNLHRMANGKLYVPAT